MSVLTEEMKKVILELIKDNLTVDVSCDSEHEYDRRYIKVTVSLDLHDGAAYHTISSSTDTVSAGN